MSNGCVWLHATDLFASSSSFLWRWMITNSSPHTRVLVQMTSRDGYGGHMTVIVALGRQRHEDKELKDSPAWDSVSKNQTAIATIVYKKFGRGRHSGARDRKITRWGPIWAIAWVAYSSVTECLLSMCEVWGLHFHTAKSHCLWERFKRNSIHV